MQGTGKSRKVATPRGHRKISGFTNADLSITGSLPALYFRRLSAATGGEL